LLYDLLTAGTAGRGSTISVLSLDVYDLMHIAHLSVIESYNVKTIVSGGAAWSDHLAVRAYLEGYIESLRLNIPGAFDTNKCVFVTRDRKDNANHIKAANYYHSLMEGKGIPSRKQIKEAIEKGAQVYSYQDFFRRNIVSTQMSRRMVAFTFATGDTPADGGTKFTWDRFNGPKVHIPIAHLGE
jgi:hypothetical protein